MKFVCISCFDYYSTRIKYISEFFRQKGYEVHYIITDYSHFEKKYAKISHPDVIHVHVPPYEKNVSVARLYSHYVFANEVFNELNRISPDIIYCIFPPNMLVKRCSQYKENHPKVKLVFDCYDSWPESMPLKSNLLKVPFLMWRNLRDKYLDFADKAICVSEVGKDWLSKLHPNLSISVLYPRLDERPEIPYCSDVADSIKFCYLGNINYITDIDLLISLLGELGKEKEVILHHIGGGNNIGDLKDRLEHCGVKFVSHGVVFDDKKKESIFSLCNLGLNLPRPEICSSMSLKSVEYMRVGLPFINSGVGDNEEIVRKYNIGINIKDKEAINKITKEDLQLMHNNCIKCYRELFSKPNYSDIFSDVF